MKKKVLAFMLAHFFLVGMMSWAAPGQLTLAGGRCSLAAENLTLAQILDLFKQQLGVKYELPPELRNQVVPLVSLINVSSRDALVKLMEGFDYDYILQSSASSPEQVAQMTITGKSVQATASIASNSNVIAPPARRFARQVVEDPFSGGGEEDENANMANEPVPINTPAAGPGMVPQGAPGGQLPTGQPNAQGMGTTPQGMVPPGMNSQSGFPGLQGTTPQQIQPSGTLVQPSPGNYNPNNRRSPF